MKNLALLCMLVVLTLTACRSKTKNEKPETIDNIKVRVGESEFKVLTDFVKKESRNDWPAGTSYFAPSSLSEYRFFDEENRSHAIQIQNEDVIMSVIIYKNTDSPGHGLAYAITKNDVWILDMPGKLFTEKQAIEIVKKDYNDLLAKAEK